VGQGQRISLLEGEGACENSAKTPFGTKKEALKRICEKHPGKGFSKKEGFFREPRRTASQSLGERGKERIKEVREGSIFKAIQCLLYILEVHKDHKNNASQELRGELKNPYQAGNFGRLTSGRIQDEQATV